MLLVYAAVLICQVGFLTFTAIVVDSCFNLWMLLINQLSRGKPFGEGEGGAVWKREGFLILTLELEHSK